MGISVTAVVNRKDLTLAVGQGESLLTQVPPS
jgi:hypothetical protein